MSARLQPNGNSLLFFSDYNMALVDALKALVPSTSRRWDKDNKAWIIDPMYGTAVASLAKQYLNVDVQVPLVLNKHAPTVRLLKLEYLGATKDRGDDERTASGWVDGGWNAIFPEPVLLKWFEAAAPANGKASTLYAALGIKNTANTDEIKSAFRRMARQWHPDICREADAKERFIEIQRAYEVLSNDLQRRKYDAGLMLERSLGIKPALSSYGYRAPLRCGWLLCAGQETLGRFVVDSIQQWEDIVDAAGRTMVSSWPAGADQFVVGWV